MFVCLGKPWKKFGQGDDIITWKDSFTGNVQDRSGGDGISEAEKLVRRQLLCSRCV